MLPIAERELRSAARQPRTYRSRLAFATISVLVFGWMIWIMRFSNGPTGTDMFHFFTGLAFIYCLLTGAALTVDSVSAEKRENTLGLLFLTHLKGYDIILGKLCASALSSFFGLLAMFPVMAIPLLMGGVQLAEFGRVALCLGNTLFLSVCLGLLVSTLSRHALRGGAVALLAILLLSFGLAGLGALLRVYYKLPRWAEGVELFSPFNCIWQAFESSIWTLSNSFWSSLLAIHLTALGFLALACWLVPYLWKERPGGRRAFSWRERMRRLKYGSSVTGQRFRTRLLEVNPFYWLAARERVSSLEFLLMLIGFVSLATWIAWRVGQEIGIPAKPLGGFVFVWFWAVLLLHALILFKMAVAATHRLAEDRSSGALELIMATPLAVGRILRGHWLALIRQMIGPVLVTLLAQIFFLRGLLELLIFDQREAWRGKGAWDILQAAWRKSPWLDPEIASVVGFMCVLVAGLTILAAITWFTLGWVGMWMGIRVKRPRTAPWAALALLMIPPWPVYGVIVYYMDHVSSFWSEFDYMFLCFKIGFGLGLLHNVILIIWSWRKLTRYFRIAVTDRFLFLNTKPDWAQRRRLAVRLAFGCLCIAGIVLLRDKFENWRGETAWNEFQRGLKAKGESLEIDSVLPRPIPDADNFAAARIWTPVFGRLASVSNSTNRQTNVPTLLMLQSINLEGQQLTWWNYGNPKYGNWQQQTATDLTALRKHLRALSQFPKSPMTTNAAAEVLFALAKFDSELNGFREAGKRPLNHFPINYLEPQHRHNFTPHLGILRHVSEVLQVRASAELDLGRADEALSDLELILRFADSFRSEPFVESHRTRHDLIGFAIQVIWEGLASTRWSADQLAVLENHLQSLALLSDYQKAVRAETIMQIEAWRRIRAVLSGEESGIYEYDRLQGYVRFFYSKGKTFRNQIAVYRFYETELAPIIDPSRGRFFPEKAEAMDRALRTADVFTNHRNLRWTLGNFPQETAHIETSVRQTRIAAALERYRRVHGDYPEKIEDLLPGSIDAVPSDLITGKPMIYRRTDDGRFLLYSVGLNGKDGGGVSRGDLDWVWRYPASQESNGGAAQQ